MSANDEPNLDSDKQENKNTTVNEETNIDSNKQDNIENKTNKIDDYYYHHHYYYCHRHHQNIIGTSIKKLEVIAPNWLSYCSFIIDLGYII